MTLIHIGILLLYNTVAIPLVLLAWIMVIDAWSGSIDHICVKLMATFCTITVSYFACCVEYAIIAYFPFTGG